MKRSKRSESQDKINPKSADRFVTDDPARISRTPFPTIDEIFDQASAEAPKASPKDDAEVDA